MNGFNETDPISGAAGVMLPIESVDSVRVLRRLSCKLRSFHGWRHVGGHACRRGPGPHVGEQLLPRACSSPTAASTASRTGSRMPA